MNPTDCFRFFKAHGPVSLREASFALATDQRRLRDHLLLHDDIYAPKIDAASGLKTWYVLPGTNQP